VLGRCGIGDRVCDGFIPTASIVITCYNQAGYLADAIRSALAQAPDASSNSVEVVVVDDGSNDRTSSVAQGFPQVRYLFQPNWGLSAARNAGLDASSGQYVCFLDADDILLPGAIESGLRMFDEHPDCAFVYGDFRDVDARGVPLSPPRGPRVAKEHYRALLDRPAMFGAVLAVLKMQRPHLRLNADLSRSSRKGVANWRECYGKLLSDELKCHLETGGLTAKTCRAFWALVISSPRALTCRVSRISVFRIARRALFDPLTLSFRTCGSRNRI
jgi:hypothetical protein